MGTGRVGDRGGVLSNALRPRRIISKFLQRTHAGEMPVCTARSSASSPRFPQTVKPEEPATVRERSPKDE